MAKKKKKKKRDVEKVLNNLYHIIPLIIEIIGVITIGVIILLLMI